MKKPSRQQLVVICGSVFVVVGIVIIMFWAYQPLWEANEWIQNPSCDDLLICKSIPLSYTRYDNNVAVANVYGDATFSSRGIFAVENPITYEIKLTSTNPKLINQVFFVIAISNDDFSEIEKIDPNKFLNRMKQEQRLIDMQKESEIEFYRNGFWTMSEPLEQVFVVFLVDENGLVSKVDTTRVLFSIASIEEKSQDTANIESRLTNKIILGLTWMGIGLAPILLGADFIVRVVLKE